MSATDTPAALAGDGGATSSTTIQIAPPGFVGRWFPMMTQSLGKIRFTEEKTPAVRMAVVPPAGVAWWLARLFVAAIVTAAAVRDSQLHGRLVLRPSPDDDVYFYEALVRLDAFYDTGFKGFIRLLESAPPHAPFSTLLASASFLVFGRYDWAPYAGNGVVVFAMLAAVDWALRSVKVWQRLLAYAFVLATRWTFTAVGEFRPDIAWGLGTAVAILFTLRSPLLSSTTKHLLAAGAWFGLATVLKPSTFPVTLCLCGLTLLLATACDLRAEGRRPARHVLRAWGLFLLGLFLAAAPYYRYAFRSTWEYFFNNSLGSRKQFWTYGGTLQTHLHYYLDGEGANFVLGRRHVIFLLSVACAGLALVWVRRRRDVRLRAAAMATLAVAAYALPTASVVKNPFLGAVFQTLLLLGGVLSLKQVLALGSRFRAPLASLIFAGVCLASIWKMRSPKGPEGRDSRQIEASTRLLDQVFTAVRSRSQGARVFVPVGGSSVSADTLRYVALLDRIYGYTFAELEPSTFRSDADFDRELGAADFVVLGEEGNDEVLPLLPVNSGALDHYIQKTRARSDLVDVAAFPTANGRHYHVFAKRFNPFGGLEALGGLSVPASIPRFGPLAVRFGEGSESVLRALHLAGGRKSILLDCRTEVANQGLTVLVDGREVGRYQFPAGDKAIEWQTLKYDVDLLPGEHEVEVRYDHCPPPPAPPRAAVFRQLQMGP